MPKRPQTPAAQEETMSTISHSLLALALALAFAAPVRAQQITTSQGSHTLMRTDGFTSSGQFGQASQVAETVLRELLQDIATVESQQSAAASTVTALPGQVKQANADYASAKSAFDARDQKYRADVASFQQRQSALEADIQNQRSEAAVQQALPSAQRDYDTLVRLDKWADKINQTRTALTQEHDALVAEHDAIETDRAKLADQRSQVENNLKGSRDATVSTLSSSSAKRTALYQDLRTTTNYLKQLRQAQATTTKRPPFPSEVLDRASDKLARYDASLPGAWK
jgi:chromosome segregation ATPase